MLLGALALHMYAHVYKCIYIQKITSNHHQTVIVICLQL